MDLNFDEITSTLDSIVEFLILGIGSLAVEIGSNLSMVAVYKVPQSTSFLKENTYKVNVIYYVYDSIFEMLSAFMKVWWTLFLILEMFEN